MKIAINAMMLKAIRRERGLSQRALADLSKLSLVTIKRIESSGGSKNCNVNEANKLSRSLGVEISHLSDDKLPKFFGFDVDIDLHFSKYGTAEELDRSFSTLRDLMIKHQDLQWMLGNKLEGDPRPDYIPPKRS